jgi:crossover junction endodeoxyribonuclease RusA
MRPPDLRKRDIDNICKAVLDALGCAGVYDDDCQIDRLLLLRGTKRKNGLVQVKISTIEG